jgi:capsular polysaccharide biosynthesis protein
MDLRRLVQAMRRYRIIVVAVAVLGLAVGVGYTFVKPPTLTSQALVWLPTTKNVQTSVLIADSTSVLEGAALTLQPHVPLATMRKQVKVGNLTANILSISASGSTADGAEDMANAVATSYLTYISQPNSPGGRMFGKMAQSATTATGTTLPVRLGLLGGLGLLAGFLAGILIALGISRGDRRLRERDEIADALGVPVLAAVPVWHPSDAAAWTKLLQAYEPSVLHAWNLRKALRYLGLSDFRSPDSGSTSLSVVSIAGDRGALALGPQLAVFTASLGIPTLLVVGANTEAGAIATLAAACAAGPEVVPNLRVGVRDEDGGRPRAALKIVVAVLDDQAPRMVSGPRTAATILAVSAGAANAEQLARVAVGAASAGRDIVGILVADPDPTDHTTGRLPQRTRMARRSRPTRVTGTATKTAR